MFLVISLSSSSFSQTGSKYFGTHFHLQITPETKPRNSSGRTHLKEKLYLLMYKYQVEQRSQCHWKFPEILLHTNLGLSAISKRTIIAPSWRYSKCGADSCISSQPQPTVLDTGFRRLEVLRRRPRGLKVV
jgi:hypothetical protein